MTDVIRRLGFEFPEELSWDDVLRVMKTMKDGGPGPVAVTNLMMREGISVEEAARMSDEDLLKVRGMGEKGIARLNMAIPAAAVLGLSRRLPQGI